MIVAEKLLEKWRRARNEERFQRGTAFHAPRSVRRRALHEARMAAQQAEKIERVLRSKYGVDPYEKLRNGEIK